MSNSGPSGRGVSNPSHAPQSQRAPSSCAWNASTSAVLPIPDSPDTSTSRPLPSLASAAYPASASRNGPRSSNSMGQPQLTEKDSPPRQQPASHASGWARRPGPFVMGPHPGQKVCDGCAAHHKHPPADTGLPVTPITGVTASTRPGADHAKDHGVTAPGEWQNKSPDPPGQPPRLVIE